MTESQGERFMTHHTHDTGYERFAARVASREATVAVVGLGYVGLPLAVEIARAGFHVVGIDVDQRKVDAVNDGRSIGTVDVSDADLAEQVRSGRLRATPQADEVARADAVIVCVPTPLNKSRDPDISYVVSAATAARNHLRPGQLFVLESTTYPGFTREVLVPMLEESGLKVGEDLFVAFSPERIDPGNRHFGVRNTPKVVGGMTPGCTRRAEALYGAFLETVHAVSSPDTAEMVKLLENTFRAVNIGLVNEVAQMCHRLGVNTWEVIEAAATKPFGFMPFYPGPGLGGHCIPIDPLYLSWKLKTLDYEARFIELAHTINTHMPEFVVRLVQDTLNERALPLRGTRILVLGVAYKRDVDDVRESPAIEIVGRLRARGADVRYHDPWVPAFRTDGIALESVNLDEGLAWCQLALITTDHSRVDYAHVVRQAPVVVDTRNATRHVAEHRERIRLL